jgi:ATP-dependent RNA/DNA helicase IGHMBP2
MTYFQKLNDLLTIEKEADQQAFLKLTENASVADRRTAGMCWYPVAIRGTEPTRGDYVSVELERTTHKELSHQLRFGASAALFSNHDPKKDRVNGTITYAGNDRLKITLLTEELPDWASDGKLGVDLLFDDNTYSEMQAALKKAALIIDKPEGRLARVLTREITPAFSSTITPLQLEGLNSSQQTAVQQILAAQDLAVVHGPPGTGKTTTLVQAIKALINLDQKQILVVAPSNTAVDLLSEKLFTEGLNVLRIGNPARVSPQMMRLTLDSKMGEHAEMKEIKRLKKQASEFKNMAHKYKRSFGRAEREQRKALFNEAHRIMKDMDKTEQYIIDDLVSKAQVITATLVGSNHYTIKGLTFETVVIDEAGQALEPACWIPILKARKLILAGDHLQLPPTVKSAEAAKAGLAETLLEKCVALHPEAVTLLDEQYRMNNAIMGFSSRWFYGDKLKANKLVADRLLFTDDLPFTFVDTAGCGFDEKQEGTSTVNPEEAGLVLRLVEKLSGHYTPETLPSVAIISPYKQQIIALKDQLSAMPSLQEFASRIDINTIDSFQGQERDAVFISLTRSNTDGIIGFLSDYRRMNVAMTRARMKLVMIGDSATLGQVDFYNQLINYAEKSGGYQSAWDYIHA